MMVLIPYIEINGEWTIPDEAMKGLYRLMEKEATAHIFFYSGTVKNEEEFLHACRPPASHAVVILEGTGEPVAIGLLNNFTHGSAHAHWVTFRRVWGTDKTDEAIRKSLEYWFHFPMFDVLLGIYPEDNAFIDAFARKAGFTVIGTVPNLLYNHWENRKVGAVISFIERRTVCQS